MMTLRATVLAAPTWPVDPQLSVALPAVLERNAHLYLWVPNDSLPQGLATVKAWGFRYVSNLVWIRRDPSGVGGYTDVGDTDSGFREVTRLVLFGVKGSMRTLPPGRRQVNTIETTDDELLSVVQSCSPGPYLGIGIAPFRDDPGWEFWGPCGQQDYYSCPSSADSVVNSPRMVSSAD